MAVDIGPKIGIEGEREFRQQIQQTNQALKTLAAEEKAVTSAFQGEADAEKKASAQKEVLNKQIEAQKDKLALLEKGLRDSTQKYGEADEKTLKWQEAVHNATAKLNNMEGQLRDVDKEVDETGDSMEDAGEKTKGWADVMKGQLLADAVKAGLSKLADLAKSAATAMWDASQAGAAYGDEILTLQSTTGLNTDTLQEYKYMADLVDVSLDTVAGSLSKLTRSMSSAKGGTGEAAEAFKELGVAITDENGNLRDTNDVFNEALTALGKIDNETERDAKAMKIFGKSAQELNPLIKTGADKLNELRKEAHDTGYVLSGSALNALGKQQDAMDRLDRKAEALKNTFASKLAPGIESAMNRMSDTMDNPRVQRGLDLVATGIGNIIDSAASLASDVLTGLFDIFDLGDVRLRTFSDDELALAASIDEARAAYEESTQAYRDNAIDIVNETERTRKLWAELQTLADENGNVKESNQERANYILHELSDALEKEFSMNDGIIVQYQDMQKEIDNLIAKREAESLLAAGADDVAEKRKNRGDKLREAEEARRAYEKAIQDLQAAEEKLQLKYEKWMSSDDDNDKLLRDYNKQIGVVNDLKAKVAELQTEFETADSTAADYYRDVELWDRAQAAIANGNYNEAVRLLADEMGVTLEYYKQKKELNEKDKQDLRDKISEAEDIVAGYKRSLEDGLVGFSAEGLKEWENYVVELKQILDGKNVAELFVQGLINGLNARRQDVYNASRNVALSVTKAVKQTLDIQSPSRVGDWIGQMWDEGLIRGMERKEEELAATASSLADTITDATTPDATVSGYGNALTASGAGSYASSSYTTNMGGIAVYVNGAGAVNEDELAKRIAVQLTDELTRAQRGGRR